ncbi:MAG TPA: glycosyltransferase family 4 protein [Aggregatilineaceae bacterium]|nr:glycosyltransferase family 4 protein [Aggregatilineaceae bacterium]
MHPRFIWVTNIPSPYRIHSLDLLNQELERRGIAFEALFMAYTESNRNWSPINIFPFPAEVVTGWHPQIGQIPFHFNPSIWWRVMCKKPDWLLIGGAWPMPTALGLYFLQYFSRKINTLFGAEVAFGSSRTNSLLGLSRNMLIRLSAGILIPGKTARQVIEDKWGITEKPFVVFPNIVDERYYYEQVAHFNRDRLELCDRYNIAPDQKIFLWPARLSPEKGILPFLDKIKTFERTNYTILIAGEGPQQPEIEAWLRAQDMHNVRLLGHQNIDNLLELYALSDVLLLPSLSEPYGFVAVEALWGKLPLFLSNRVGAVPEVIEPGSNGWLVDPDNDEQVCQAFQDALACSRQQLEQMGQHSLRLAEKNFASRPCVERFVDDLLSLFPPRT